MKLTLVCALFISLHAFCSYAQTTLTIGSKTPSIHMKDVVTGGDKSLEDYDGQKGVVLVFHSITCPFAKMYDARLGALIDEFKSKGIAFIFVDTPTNAVGESNGDIKIFKQKFGRNIEYWVDSDRKVGKLLGATKVPQVFVLKKVNATTQILFYSGAIDNNPSSKSITEECYLQDALKALVTGGSIKVTTKSPSGCAIDDY